MIKNVKKIIEDVNMQYMHCKAKQLKLKPQQNKPTIC